jgi:hypothetical protein
LRTALLFGAQLGYDEAQMQKYLETVHLEDLIDD